MRDTVGSAHKATALRPSRRVPTCVRARIPSPLARRLSVPVRVRASTHPTDCNVGAGVAGAAFLQKLADDGNMTVTAWDGVKSTDGDMWYTYDGTSLVTKTPAP